MWGEIERRRAANAGAGERTRTADLLITNQLLYQLSYAGFLRARDGRSGRNVQAARKQAC